MDELELKEAVRRGDRGADVKRVQEWLFLRGHRVSPDGIFGPATQAEVKRFQAAQGLAADGVVTPQLFTRLCAPMRAALRPIAPRGRDLPTMLVAYARQHLKQGPREVGGDNGGPWVRLYMRGNDGPSWRWCAGFVCYCLAQASEALSLPMPFKYTFSVDVLAMQAAQRGLFIDGDVKGAKARVLPGSLFLIRRAPNDWQHVGIVTRKQAEWFRTIEGNTNDEGSVNGNEVAERTRSYADRDFVRVPSAKHVDPAGNA